MPANKSANAALASSLPGLSVVLDGKTIEKDAYVPRAEAQNTPELLYSAAIADPTKKFIIVCLDMDAPYPSLPILGPILHWIQSDLTLSDGKLTTTAPFIADYIGPAPPPPSGPHRYCFFLYEQPDGFDAKKFAPPNGAQLARMKRMRSDLDAFEKEAGLGKIIACTGFTSN